LADTKFIDTGSYPVYIGSDIYTILQNFIQLDTYKKSRFYVLTDENTNKFCLPRLLDKVGSLSYAGMITIPPGEHNKSIETCGYVWNYLTREKADRHSILINLGGGMVTDLGGFAASTYKRGIRSINVPTTLIGQIDASIGGKVGVDYGSLKNLIGCYNNPQAVFIDPTFLSTLDETEKLSGFAEIIKYGLISDASFFHYLYSRPVKEHTDWISLIEKSVEIKTSVVKIDPVERKYRKVLNFGHTIGHALESSVLETGNRNVSHGSAVATGMICATWISGKQLNLPQSTVVKINTYIAENIGIVGGLASHRERILQLVSNDKKNERGKILFTLIAGIGNAVINREVSIDMIAGSIDYCIGLEEKYAR